MSKPLDSSHFYAKDGKPMHEVPKAKGDGMRKTTIADARKMGLYPSVTTILNKTLAKPELDNWKMKQVAWAALTFPHQPEEDDQKFIDRIIVDAFEQVQDAADLGTNIHKALENHYQRLPVEPEMRPYVDPVFALTEREKISFMSHEQRIVSPHGYAGTTDGLATAGPQAKVCVVDYKSRKTTAGKKITPWATEPLQIAAYAKATGAVIGCNIYISTTEPGRVEIVWYDELTLDKNWDAFLNVFEVWKHLNSYDPSMVPLGSPKDLLAPAGAFVPSGTDVEPLT